MKKCKECGRDEWGFLSSLNEDGYCPTCAIKHNQDKIKRLQEQIKEADELIKDYVHDANDCFTMGRIRKYLEKWGAK